MCLEENINVINFFVLLRQSAYLRKAGRFLCCSGNKVCPNCSKASAYFGGTTYQLLGSPKWRRLMLYKSLSSLCIPKVDLHIPTYKYAVLIPFTLGFIISNMEGSLLMFLYTYIHTMKIIKLMLNSKYLKHVYHVSMLLSVRVPSKSDPYTGSLVAKLLQYSFLCSSMSRFSGGAFFGS